MAAWKWNEAAGRYYNIETGRFMPRVEVLGYVDDSIAATSNATDLLANYVSEGMIAPTDWHDLMKREIKDEYVRQGILGRGGRAQMTQADWGSIGGQLKEQYGWLEKFAEQVASGELSEGAIRARSRMYINSAREAFERAQAKVAADTGKDEVIWVINLSAENCPDCEDFANMGWQKVADNPYGGAYPGSGDTVCLTSCQCFLDYRDSTIVEGAE